MECRYDDDGDIQTDQPASLLDIAARKARGELVVDVEEDQRKEQEKVCRIAVMMTPGCINRCSA